MELLSLSSDAPTYIYQHRARPPTTLLETIIDTTHNIRTTLSIPLLDTSYTPHFSQLCYAASHYHILHRFHSYQTRCLYLEQAADLSHSASSQRLPQPRCRTNSTSMTAASTTKTSDCFTLPAQ